MITLDCFTQTCPMHTRSTGGTAGRRGALLERPMSKTKRAVAHPDLQVLRRLCVVGPAPRGQQGKSPTAPSAAVRRRSAALASRYAGCRGTRPSRLVSHAKHKRMERRGKTENAKHRSFGGSQGIVPSQNIKSRFQWHRSCRCGVSASGPDAAASP